MSKTKGLSPANKKARQHILTAFLLKAFGTTFAFPDDGELKDHNPSGAQSNDAASN